MTGKPDCLKSVPPFGSQGARWSKIGPLWSRASSTPRPLTSWCACRGLPERECAVLYLAVNSRPAQAHNCGGKQSSAGQGLVGSKRALEEQACAASRKISDRDPPRMNPEQARLKRIVARGETTTTECKSQLDLQTKDGRGELAKRIIGVANACKRTSYVALGAHDDGTPSGIDHTSLKEERLQQIVAEYCEPFVDVGLRHIDVAGNPVSVIEIHRRVSDLPYRAAKTQGAGPILEHGFVYYRYGRNTQKARFAEISSLIREGDKERRGASPADEYR
jgi:hypothetical protein